MILKKAPLHFLLAGLFLFVAVYPAYTYAIDEASDGESTLTIQDYIKDFVDIPEGATDWKVLGSTAEKKISGVDEEGFDYEYTLPEFSAQVKPLDGKTVKLKGFMFPLEENDAQSLFLFGPFPISCPYHYHVGPSLIVEVKPKKAIVFTYDPIILEGKMELVPNDIETGVFYRLHGARVVK